MRSFRADTKGSLKSIPYEETKAARPPIPITTAPSPSSTRLGVHPSLRPKISPELSPSSNAFRPMQEDEVRRNSGFATSNSTARESHTTIATDVESAYSIRHSPSLPRITTKHDSVPSLRSKSRKWSGYKIKQVEAQEQVPRVPRLPFKRIATDIPTSSFEDLTSPGKIEFSNRGSMLIGGQKVTGLDRRANSHAIMTGNPRQPSTSASVPTSTVPSRVLSADDEILSRQVRSMYDSGTDKDEVLVAGNPLARNRAEAGEENVDVDRTSSTPSRTDDVSTTSKPVVPHDRSASCATTVKSGRESMIQREIHELAGGVEDWEDVSSSDVDRYGFIVPQLPSRGSSSTSQNVAPPERLQLQRVSTSLQIASEAPRRQRSKLGRSPSNKGSTRSPTIPASAEKPLRRPSTSQRSYQSTFDRQPSRIRSTTNFLPYNRDRRWKDEAGDMLTLPPGLADIAEHEDSGKVAIELKRKEWEREEKWRKMGKVVSTRHVGGGMIFEFDTKNPKLIERTWKGIPDRWRASAWHAFLTASAKRRPGSPTDEQLIAEFHELMVQSSPDDVQIDIDVPRTINSHIMFRRRYRGGQRLLFRVLHCLSIYFPDTGYVQGMAALAATLLCYYDEELTFVMLVRLWQLRGLARLYQSGFEGLMEALDDFEKNWLAGGEIAAKLTDLGISPTAYGTRWYLTLFNYSIPFPAQLRIWDVFMLLGDADDPSAQDSSSPNAPFTPTHPVTGGLDVLHATSAALIDGTRDILLSSDFENAMKVLTSWIPIRDEDLLMRVAKAEWKVHRRKK